MLGKAEEKEKNKATGSKDHGRTYNGAPLEDLKEQLRDSSP